MAEWPGGIVDQFFNDTSTISHGSVGTWWTILVQCCNGCERCRNVTYKERIKMTPYMQLYGKKKDIAMFRAFGCSAYVYLNEEQKRKGQAHSPSG